jgi:acetyl-CoA decarbonylase/synthase complex subunit gamma
VLFRHEKTFYNRPGVFIKVSDNEDVPAKVEPAEKFAVSYVGMDLTIDGFAIEATGDAERFVAAIKTVRTLSQRPIVMISPDAKVIASGLEALSGEAPLICGANANNWEAMADLAKANKAALVVKADSIEALADLTEKIKAKGVEDLVIDPAVQNLGKLLTFSTQVRRLALKKNVRSVGYPIMVFANDAVLAAQAVSKYGGFIVLDEFKPETVYPLLVLRQNIYTDPQKPIQVQPGLYEINNPRPESPVLITTNFSITYFSVANEVESSGLPAWLLVTDAEGMSVLTAWAAGKFDAERIAKAVKGFNVADKISQKRVVLPGHVAVLSGELEAELAGWDIKVGPREAVDLPAFMKQVL